MRYTFFLIAALTWLFSVASAKPKLETKEKQNSPEQATLRPAEDPSEQNIKLVSVDAIEENSDQIVVIGRGIARIRGGRGVVAGSGSSNKADTLLPYEVTIVFALRDDIDKCIQLLKLAQSAKFPVDVSGLGTYLEPEFLTSTHILTFLTVTSCEKADGKSKAATAGGVKKL